MNTNLKRAISGLAALGIALSSMALGAGSAWADNTDEEGAISAGETAVGRDATGAITISGGKVEHTFDGYQLGYLTSITYDEIKKADFGAAVMAGYAVETNQAYKRAIYNALDGITDTNAEGDAATKTLKARYLADKNYCGDDCYATGDPNPLGWFFANYGDLHENGANWGGDAKDGTSDTVLRKFATKVSAELSKGSFAATYSGDGALKSEMYGYRNPVSQGFYLLRDVTSLPADGGGVLALDRNKETQSAPILVSSTYDATLKDGNNANQNVTFTITRRNGYEDTLGQVSLKNSTPTITREVVTDRTGETSQSSPDYAVGDDVYYKLTAQLPYFTGYAADATDPGKGRVYKITDTTSAGLTVDIGDNARAANEDAVVSVKVTSADGKMTKDLVRGADYTVNFDSSTADDKYKNGTITTIDFANYVNLAAGTTSSTNGIFENGTITVILKATLNNEAEIADSGYNHGNPVKDSLTYSNQPEDVTQTHTAYSNEVNVYTYRFRLLKTDKGGKGLEGATFKVKAPGDGDRWLYWNPDTSVWGYESERLATKFTSNENGEVVYTYTDEDGDERTVNFDRLDSGTYTVKETEAPEGYPQAFLPEFSFTITPDWHESMLTGISFSTCKEVDNLYVTKADHVSSGKSAWQYTIYNAKNLTQLPMTGGAGLAAVIAVGVLLGGAGIAAAVRSRKSNTRAVRA